MTTPHPESDPVIAPAMDIEITRTDCHQCGTELHGINGRYACTVCGWVNPWSEGHTDLPVELDEEAR
ncbi:hypothetical protein [Streptomyces formicae]|uniref:Uncharacterized protein n=1 Tax=Streptomyces formicae TaxID=1616117 RepID=A0ABY3X2B4_9ACTN|nr:hypothetical protein [Streptomyces formicae]UNM16911.1 hypothetical protein J4032_11645 [Streptomyces formicae]